MCLSRAVVAWKRGYQNGYVRQYRNGNFFEELFNDRVQLFRAPTKKPAGAGLVLGGTGQLSAQILALRWLLFGSALSKRLAQKRRHDGNNGRSANNGRCGICLQVGQAKRRDQANGQGGKCRSSLTYIVTFGGLQELLPELLICTCDGVGHLLLTLRQSKDALRGARQNLLERLQMSWVRQLAFIDFLLCNDRLLGYASRITDARLLGHSRAVGDLLSSVSLALVHAQRSP